MHSPCFLWEYDSRVRKFGTPDSDSGIKKLRLRLRAQNQTPTPTLGLTVYLRMTSDKFLNSSDRWCTVVSRLQTEF